ADDDLAPGAGEVCVVDPGAPGGVQIVVGVGDLDTVVVVEVEVVGGAADGAAARLAERVVGAGRASLVLTPTVIGIVPSQELVRAGAALLERALDVTQVGNRAPGVDCDSAFGGEPLAEGTSRRGVIDRRGDEPPLGG